MRFSRAALTAAALAVIFLLVGVVSARHAHADAKAKKDIEQKIKEAMENYDLLEYEEARKILNQALTIAKKAKMESDPVTAKVHVRLGIVYFAGLNDPESAKLSFLNAAEIDKGISIEKAYSTPEMLKLLEEAKAEAGGGGGGGDTGGDTGDGGGDTGDGGGEDMAVDCASVTGVQHTIVEEAKGGRDLVMQAAVGADVQPAKMAVMYRARGATDFTEAKMTLSGECVYKGAIPADALKGDLVHYYIAAYNAGGKLIASKGSAGSPNIIEVSGGGGGGSGGLDDENPLGDGGGGGGGGGEIRDNGNDVRQVVPGSDKKTLFLQVAVGSGGGLVTGKTEGDDNSVKCCFAPQLVHVFPEIGYYLSPSTTVSVAGRIGFPIGANLAGHATAAPAGLIRVRHAFSPTGHGLHVAGGIGGGIMRDTIKLDGAPAEMDTDIVAIGPLLFDAGAGYTAKLGSGLAFIAEFNAIVGVPVVKELGSSKVNFGVQLDANLGIIIGF